MTTFDEQRCRSCGQRELILGPGSEDMEHRLIHEPSCPEGPLVQALCLINENLEAIRWALEKLNG